MRTRLRPTNGVLSRTASAGGMAERSSGAGFLPDDLGGGDRCAKTLQVELADRLEDVGTAGEHLDDLTHEDLAALRCRLEAGSLHDGGAEVVIVFDLHVAGTNPDTDGHRFTRDRMPVVEHDPLLQLDGGGYGVGDRDERGHEAVAEVFDDRTPVTLDLGGCEDPIVLVANALADLIADATAQSRRCDHVGEQNRRGFVVCSRRLTSASYEGDAQAYDATCP